MVSIPGWSDDELERRAQALAALIRRAWRAIAKAIFNALKTKSFVTQSDVRDIPSAWNTQLEELIITHVRDTYVAAAQNVAASLNMPEDLVVGEDLVAIHLDEVRNRLRGVGDDVWQITREQILDGIHQGESVPEIAARVQNVTGVSTGRALTIARTEVHAAHEAGSYEQALFVDPTAIKIWLATNDERTRDSHRAADGQRVRIGQPFNVGDSELRYPGDPLGDPSETINCRCSVVYDFDLSQPISDEEMSDSDGVAVTAAGDGWDSKKHPRGKDGRFIKKGTPSYDALTAKYDDEFYTAVNKMSYSDWSKLTDDQKSKLYSKASDYSDENAEPEMEDAFDKIKKYTSQDVVAPAGAPTPSAPTQVSPTGKPKLQALLTNAKHGDLIASGTRNGKKFSIFADKSNPLLYPAGQLRLEIYNKDGSVSKAVVGDTITISSALSPGLKKTNIQWDPTPSNLLTPPSIATPPTTVATPTAPTPTGGAPLKITTGVIWGKYDANTVVAESPDGKTRLTWDGAKYLKQTKSADGSWVTDESLTKKNAYGQLKGQTWVTPSSATVSNSMFAKPSAATPPPPTTADMTPSITPTTPSVTSPIPAKMAGKPGDQAKVTTGVIWSAHPNGQHIVVSPDGKKRVIWDDDQKKYLNQSYDESTGTWKTNDVWSKNAAYTALKNDKNWVVPGATPALTVPDTSQKKLDELQSKITPTTTTPAATLTPYTSDDIIESWDFLDAPYAAGTVVATTPDGKTRIIKSAGVGFDVEKYDETEGWGLEATLTHTNAAAVAAKYGDTWIKPPLGTSNSSNALTSTDVTNALSALHAGTLSDDDLITLLKGLTPQLMFDSGFSENDHSKMLDQMLPIGKALGDAGLLTKFIDDTKKFYAMKSSTTTKPSVPSVAPSVTTSTTPAASGPDLNAIWHGGFTYEDKQYFELNAEDGTMSPDGAIAYVSGMTLDDYAQLSDKQKTTIADILQYLQMDMDEDSDKTPRLLADKFEEFANVVSPVSSGPSVPTVGTPPVSVPTTSPIAVPGTSATAVTFDDKIPNYVAVDFKMMLKDKKLGHWSKPEKLWDVIKEIQQKYPHPTEAGYSKYSPLGILSALDKTTATKKSSTAFTDKMTKWAASTAGIEYIKKSGVMTSGLKPANPTPATSGSPTPSAPSVPTPGDALAALGGGDISGLSTAKKKEIYEAFKEKPGSYADSPPTDLYFNSMSVAKTSGVTQLQALRAIDEYGAQKFGVANKFIFEKAVSDWLKTPLGAAAVASGATDASGFTPPKPPTPAFKAGINPNELIPSFEESSKLKYDIVSAANAPELYKQFTGKYGEWTTAEKSGLKAYTSNTVYRPVNKYLWGETTSITPANMKHMKNAQAGMRPSTVPLLLHRGTGYKGIGNAKNHADVLKMKGQTWKGDGFMSTSVGGKAAFGGSVLIEIEAPPGTPMAYVDPISNFPGEHEMLLAAGLTYQIIDVTSDPGLGYTTVIRARVVPEVEVV